MLKHGFESMPIKCMAMADGAQGGFAHVASGKDRALARIGAC